ncbi:MAG: hypothetical protein RJA70_4079 [Pseudomonadota bacterium]
MSRPHLQVGFLADNLAEEYQRRVFQGLNQEALRLDISITAIVGGTLAQAGSPAQRNQLYDCISQTHLDALVVCTGPLSRQLGLAHLAEFLGTLAPIPIYCVGALIHGFPSLTVDSQAGVRAALEHLTEQGKRRRVAFLRGPETNPQSEELYAAYESFLFENGLAFNPELVTHGNFEAPSGADAVRALIDERHVGFDALVAASDLMALGAMNELVERGIPVPDRVSVVGFGDIESSRFATAPLTTIREPLEELGKRALAKVVRQNYSQPFEQSVVLPAVLVQRRSSRDSAQALRVPDALSAGRPRNTTELLAVYHSSRSSLCEDLRVELAGEGLDSDWSTQLCNAFISDVCGRRSGLLKRATFVDYLEHWLLQVTANNGELSSCQEVIVVLRQRVLPWLHELPLQRDLAEQLWHQARMVIAGIAERFQVQQRLELAYWRRSVQDLGSELMRCDTLEQLGAAIPEVLPQLGIPACYICTFEPPDQSRLRIGYDLYEAAEYPVAVFPANELLPSYIRNAKRRTSLVVEALYTSEKSLGYVMFEMGPTEPEVYALLRDYITGALRGIELDYEAPDDVPEPPPAIVGEPGF